MELSEQERLDLGLLVTEIFDHWKLSDDDQICLLGLPESTKPRELTRYRHGQVPLPQEDELIDRAKHILGIQQSLEVLFPLNRNMPKLWLRSKYRPLHKRIPLQLMIEEGLVGMDLVWRSLDCTRNWEVD